MTRIWNDPAEFRADMVTGFVSVYGRYVERVPGTSGVMRAGGAREGKTSILVGGGSGHYPAFCGVVGPGLADGAVIGDIFTSPSTEQAYRVGKATDGGAGVIFSYGNYAGDVLNFDAAQERLRADGIDARTVLVTDDVASGAPEEAEKRRGIAGGLGVFKTLGAAAEQGLPIDDIERLGQLANSRMRTFGVAFAGCTLPGAGEPLFTVEPGKMELGLGIHGEPGIETAEKASASDLARILLDPLVRETPDGAGSRVAVWLNGLGGTKYEELFVLWGSVAAGLADAGLEPVMPEAGEMVTSLDMAGVSLTVLWLDDELEELWVAPCDTPAFRRGDASGSAFAGGARVDAEAKLAAAEAELGETTPESEAAAAQAVTALSAQLDMLAAREEEFGKLDSFAGDGDHGAGMLRGSRAAVDAVGGSDGSGSGGLGSTLRAAGAAWGDKAGGTSGMLWGEMLNTLGSEFGDADAPDADAVARAVRAAAETVKRLGKSDVGDKTLLDALVPFADALDSGLSGGGSLASVWSDAVAAAEQGADATADLTPRVGRARPLAERSKGHPDPGAVSMAASLKVVGEALGS